MLQVAHNEVNIAARLMNMQNRLLMEHLLTYEGFIESFMLWCDV